MIKVAINWTYMTSIVENGFDLLITMMEKLPEVIVPVVGVIIILIVPAFASRLSGKITTMLGKIKF